jgi:hypothetical protein
MGFFLPFFVLFFTIHRRKFFPDAFFQPGNMGYTEGEFSNAVKVILLIFNKLFTVYQKKGGRQIGL